MTRLRLALKVKEKNAFLLSALRSSLFLLLPTQLALHFWPSFSFIKGIRVDYLSPAIYLTDLAVILNLFFLPFPKIKKSWLVILTILVFGNLCISLSPAVTFFHWLKVIELILLGTVIYKNFAKVQHIISPTLSLSLLFSLFLGLAQIVKSHSINGMFYFLGERNFGTTTPGIALFESFGSLHLRPYATFSHPNSLAGFALVSLFILIYLKDKSSLVRLGKIAAVLLVLISISQAAWLALFLALAYLVFVKSKHWHLSTLLFLSVIASLLLLPTSSVLINLSTGYPQEILLRLQLVHTSGLVFINNPFLGVGLGNFIPAVNSLHLPPNWFALNTYYYQPVHNVWLLLLNELGLIGLVGISLVLFRKFAQVNSKVIVAGWIGILLIAVVDHYWLTLQQNLLVLTLFAAITLRDTIAKQ